MNIELDYGATFYFRSTTLDPDGDTATGASMRMDIAQTTTSAVLLSLPSATYAEETTSGTFDFAVGAGVITTALTEGRTYQYTLWTILSDGGTLVRQSGKVTAKRTVA